jgi:molybdopterin-guanine dinucleotide biosynthesis protein A
MTGTSASPCTGVILAGGRASRFGGVAKGLLDVGGERIVDRVARALAGAAEHLLLVSNAAEAATWLPDVACVPDDVPGLGPLGGLLTALRHARTAVLVVAWDMPLVPAALLRELRARGEHAGAPAVPESVASRSGIEPLCAYVPAAWLPEVERAISAGERRMDAVLADTLVLRLPRADVVRFGDPALMFANVNTRGDLHRVRDLVDGER